MYAILNPRIGLRSWPDVPFAYYEKCNIHLFSVSKREFSVPMINAKNTMGNYKITPTTNPLSNVVRLSAQAE